jgi:hypothetical protein
LSALQSRFKQISAMAPQLTTATQTVLAEEDDVGVK